MNTKDYIVRLEDLKRPIEKNHYDPNTGNIAAYMRYLRYNTPPAQPKRIRGRWTRDNACSECGCQPWFSGDIHNYNFCPNCGADMREVTT